MEILSINKPAGFTRRFIAFIIDRFILWVVLSLIVSYILGVSNSFQNFDYNIDMYNWGNLFSRQFLVTELLLMAYFVVSETSSWQATIGKRMMGMKVVTTNYQKLEIKDAILRYLSKYLSMAVMGLGFIWIIFDDKKQGWHDKIANTFIIKN